MIKYNSTYDRWVTDDGLVYRQDKLGAFVLCKQSIGSNGYLTVRLSKPFRSNMRVHRLVWETFKGTIPRGYELDHQDTHRDNNSLDNLILCTHKENMNNSLTIQHRCEINLKKSTNGFVRKYFEHFGYSWSENPKQYIRELSWFNRHDHTCRWE